MKAKFKKDWHNPQLYRWPLLFLIMWLVLLLYGLWLNLHWSNFIVLVVCPFPSFVNMLSSYRITDTNNLKGGNGILNVGLISRIECFAKGGFRIFYGWKEAGRIRTVSVYPKDERAFISKLIEINPNIQIQR